LDLIAEIPLFDRPLRVLDLGGEEPYWSDKIALIGRSLEITLVNLYESKPSKLPFIAIKGDARSLAQFPNNSFDIVHSNSVIEHVGSWKDMKAMASEVRRLAPAYFVQTPYFWFPVEPHFRAVGYHWLPEPVRARRLMSRALGFVGKADSFDAAMEAIRASVLLDRPMFADLFPDSDIVFERVFGLRKSMMAIRHIK